jgi:hypothetical protein
MIAVKHPDDLVQAYAMGVMLPTTGRVKCRTSLKVTDEGQCLLWIDSEDQPSLWIEIELPYLTLLEAFLTCGFVKEKGGAE